MRVARGKPGLTRTLLVELIVILIFALLLLLQHAA